MDKVFNLTEAESARVNLKYNCYLVIYDIQSNKTRNKLSKLLEGYGVRVQKSCFEIRMGAKELQGLLNRLNEFFDGEEDIICYKIYANEIVRYSSTFVKDEDPVLLFI